MWRYLILLSLAETTAIAVVSLSFAMVSVAGLPQVTILGAGAFEGLCIGVVQAAILRDVQIQQRRWVLLTVISAAAGYGAVMLGSPGDAVQGAAEPPLVVILGVSAVMGLAMGGLLGAFQALARGPKLPARGWIIANALGWVPAMTVIMLVAKMAQDDWTYLQVAASGAGAGAAAGALVALATWPVIAAAQR